MISPGQTIGVLGGGPLGRMFAQAAQTLGYRVHVFEPQAGCPAGAVANKEVNAPYEDLAALRDFARSCAVVTCEVENIPVEPLRALPATTQLRPSPEVLHICQNRQREKHWLGQNKFSHAVWAEALDGDVAAAAARVGLPCVVKTADFGSDGEGQMKLVDHADLEQAAAIFRGRRCVVERWVDFACELSVIVARTERGETRVFPLAENIHTRHILDFSIVPARVGAAVAAEAQQLARDIAGKLGVVGLLAVEMFLTDRGELLVNELAPRPHNSGHWSIDGCETGQFEQQARAVCGLPLGPVDVREPTVMVNILGDLWQGGREPDWTAILAEPKARLHLYGRREPRAGRKMGHFTVRAAEVETALEVARRLKAKLAGEI
ncbi:MAG TPA: 5-(carboxyamino)imidazole ribonucleotide synthase [Opitutaceae bacterium]|jgi:5-(carboxyamino)imidazole ribonucleotide synthase|nr:5-(carboxyamino)imidazole ribonucleotide synthase [Opitutaceae bacterium]